MDFMQGPFLLPIDVSEGDYIEIGSLGAYSLQLRTQFNGFNYSETVEVSDGPLLSMYGLVESSKMDAVTATSPELVPIELSGETY
jgi:ornithine decarboxylase